MTIAKEYANTNSIIITNRRHRYDPERLNLTVVYTNSIKAKYDGYKCQMGMNQAFICGVQGIKFEFSCLPFAAFSRGIVDSLLRKYRRKFDRIILDIGLSNEDMYDYDIDKKIIFVS